ncbi:hypothetical protein COU18_02000 [Candidatus Kaiserbacteria bacterium CG10_big_fil_rev_8_21_14_0_10_51_14]|uniref:Peptidase M15A C-terminal domain-containing protein n=1 Tax=Candidatus Kaiserbacteria bacterium CG10_big_fil_rev_8_21_14_0_10_51_14 TaxID=1974610 RepID=A0A2H0UBP8_9BACT|nr:MAG: hypothetical protein COU18_02000 [Candidatus Kaiserbacteria bacterium CG10_big_fil_rev_8_21_14_0_10_51_14]
MMLTRKRLVASGLILLATVFLVNFLSIPRILAQTVSSLSPLIVTCPSGTVPITSEARPSATAAGIPVSSQCWDPSDTIVGESVGEAKRYLLSIARGLPDTHAPPDEAHIARLNNTLAICAARFFSAYRQQYGPVTVTSAYRDGPSGENERAGGAPGSNHTRGLAIDVHPSGPGSSYETMWRFASQNPQFGVCFPHQDGGAHTTGYRDRPHMILAGIPGSSEAAACARQGVVRACDGSNVPDVEVPSGVLDTTVDGEILPPPFYVFPEFESSYSEPQRPPTSSIFDFIRNILLLGSSISRLQDSGPQGGSNGSTGSADSDSPVPRFCEPKFSCASNVLYYHTTSCTKQFYESCQFGCGQDGTSCAPQTVGANNLAPGNQFPSTFEPEPISNFIDSEWIPTGNFATLQYPTSSEDTSASGTVTLLQPTYISSETFTSSDLASNSPRGFTGRQEQNGFLFQVLTSMKNTLLSALNFLRSFGGNAPR